MDCIARSQSPFCQCASPATGRTCTPLSEKCVISSLLTKLPSGSRRISAGNPKICSQPVSNASITSVLLAFLKLPLSMECILITRTNLVASQIITKYLCFILACSSRTSLMSHDRCLNGTLLSVSDTTGDGFGLLFSLQLEQVTCSIAARLAGGAFAFLSNLANSAGGLWPVLMWTLRAALINCSRFCALSSINAFFSSSVATAASSVSNAASSALRVSALCCCQLLR